MPAERRPGMEHEHYEWSPINRRGALRWPDGARIALCVVVTLEKMEWEAPQDTFTVSLPGGIADRPFPDYARVSHREYGHRVRHLPGCWTCWRSTAYGPPWPWTP